MPSVLPKHTHVDKSLAKGISRQIIHDAIEDMERRRNGFSKRVARLSTLPKNRKKRLNVLVRHFAGLFGSSLICQTRSPDKRDATTMFFLDYSRHHQVLGAPITLEVMIFPVSADMTDTKIFHSGIRVSQHVLERVIQRNGARTIGDVAKELRLPILYLFFAEQHGELDMPSGKAIMVPTPNGFLYCGNEGPQPYENMVLKTFITFVHFSQMSDEQRNQWHFYVSNMPEDFSCLYPSKPGMPCS